MNKFLTLLKFEFLSNTTRFKDVKLFSRIKNIILAVLGVGAFVAIFLYAINIIMNVFIKAQMQHEFLILFFTFMMILFFITSIVMSVKVLYFRVNLSILSLPVNGKNIFFSKLIFMFARQLFFSFIIIFPVMILFGVRTLQNVGFYLLLVPNIVLITLFPFLLAILFTTPIMGLIKLLKNRFFILFIIYTLILVAGFILYIFALKFILKILESGNFSNVFDESTIFQIRQFSSYIYLSILFKNSFILYNFAKSFLINLALIAFVFALVYWFAEKCYMKMIFSSKMQRDFKKKTKVRHQKIGNALLSKEFKNIFRSSNYSFQYLTIVITTPLMVYFSSEIASSIGAAFLGEGVISGVVILVLIMFLSMGTSFSATSITREAGNFFLTKIMPVSYTKQIFVKFSVYLIISIPAIFISCFILAFVNFISYLAAFLMSIALCFIVIGNVSNSILIDIKRPLFQNLENGEILSTNKNVSSSIGIGFGISVLIGVGAIMLSFFINIPSIYLVLFGFGVPYACIESFRLFYKAEKRYYAIEV